VELAPRDADDPPARGLEPPVTGAVGFERVRRGVGRVAVELDYEAVVGPGAVGFDSFDEDVGLRDRETRIDEECLEAFLELASRSGQAALCLFNHGSYGWETGAAGVALDQVT